MTFVSPGFPLAQKPAGPRLSIDPRGDIMIGGAVAGLFFIGFLGWAALQPLDSAAVTSGIVVVTGHRQAVQTRDAGIISAILVAEGSRVRAGQVLMQVDAGDVQAMERALTGRMVSRVAQIAALQAQQSGAAAIAYPAEFSVMTGVDRAAADAALAAAQQELRARRQAEVMRRGMLRERISQADQQIVGFQRQAASLSEQQGLMEKDVAAYSMLAKDGYVSEVQLRNLQRSSAQLVGSAGSNQAEIGRLRAVQDESRLQMVQGDATNTAQLADQIRVAQADLQEITSQLAAAKAQLSRASLKSPVDGVVVGLTVNTVGGVIGAGQKILEVVPTRADLVIEAQLPSKQANGISVGAPADLHFEALNARKTPKIHGTVTRLSADSFQNEKTGRYYYTAEVTIPRSQLATIEKAEGGRALRPGEPVQVSVPMRKRSALQYMLEPITQALSRSFREG